MEAGVTTSRVTCGGVRRLAGVGVRVAILRVTAGGAGRVEILRVTAGGRGVGVAQGDAWQPGVPTRVARSNEAVRMEMQHRFSMVAFS